MTTPEKREERVRQRLRALLAERGARLAEVERAAGWSSGYLSQVLKGKIDLKVQHLFEILEAVEEPPESFFGEMFDADLGRSLRALLRAASRVNGEAGRQPIEDAEVRQAVQRIVEVGRRAERDFPLKGARGVENG